MGLNWLSRHWNAEQRHVWIHFSAPKKGNNIPWQTRVNIKISAILISYKRKCELILIDWCVPWQDRAIQEQNNLLTKKVKLFCYYKNWKVLFPLPSSRYVLRIYWYIIAHIYIFSLSSLVYFLSLILYSSLVFLNTR